MEALRRTPAALDIFRWFAKATPSDFPISRAAFWSSSEKSPVFLLMSWTAPRTLSPFLTGATRTCLVRNFVF